MNLYWVRPEEPPRELDALFEEEDAVGAGLIRGNVLSWVAPE